MARHYVIQDWSNSATWSGEMIGDRLSKSKGHHFLKNGMANTEMYAGDEEEDNKRKSRVPLKQRILPQASRLDKLNAEIVELENEYRSGAFSIEEYSMLRGVAFKRRDRAQVLLKRAMKVDEKGEQAEGHTQSPNVVLRGEKMQQKGQMIGKLSGHSAKTDAIIFLTGAASLLVLFKMFF